MTSNPFNTSKSFSIKSVMKSPKTVKLVSEALKAPVGSSKREQARSALRSLMTLRGNMLMPDGRGGAVMGESDWNLPVANAPQGVQQNLQVKPLEKYVPGSPIQGSQPIDLQGSSYMPQSASSLSQIGQPNAVMAGAEAVVQPEERAVVKGVPDPTKTDKSEMDWTGLYSGYEDTREESWAKLPQEQFKTVIESLKSGVGPEAFAYQIMGSVDEMKRLFPGVPEEDLPVGASLTGQLADLKANLKQEYQIDEQLKRVNDLQKRGLNITQDFQSYVKGRDEYLSRLDSMINKAKDFKVTADMSNPATANMMNKYLNYLYTLKGRQDSRYTQYVNDSINQFNDELKIAQDGYNTAKTQFQEAFTAQGTMAKEDYDRLKGMLTDMYKNLAGIDDTLLKREEAYYDKEKARYDMIEAALDSQGAGDKMGYTEWAIEKGIAGMPEYQVDDLLYSPTPTDWFKETKDQEQEALGQPPLDEVALTESWNEQRAKMADGTNKQADIDWATQYINSKLSELLSDSKKIYEVKNDVRAMTEGRLTVGEIDDVFKSLGFTQILGQWIPPYNISAEPETQQQNIKDMADIQKKVIDLGVQSATSQIPEKESRLKQIWDAISGSSWDLLLGNK